MEPQQTNITPEITPQVTKTDHKIFYILILIFIALVGSAVYLFLQYPKKEVVQSVPIQNEVEEWKTYRNEEYGFEFKYPDNWLLKSSNPSLCISGSPCTNFEILHASDEYDSYIDIKYNKNGCQSDIYDWGVYNDTESYAEKSFCKDGLYIKLGVRVGEKKEVFINQMNIILSTFKFTKIFTSTSILDYSNIRSVVEKAIIKDTERTNLSRIKLLSVKIENQNNNLVTLVLDFNSSFFNEPSFTGFEGGPYETTLVYMMEDLKPIFKELYATSNKKPALDLTENGEERDGMLIDERDYK